MSFQIHLALQYLTGRKLRAFLTTLAIVIGVMVIFGMGILLPTFTDALQKALISASGQVDVTITHKSGEAFSTSNSATGRTSATPPTRMGPPSGSPSPHRIPPARPAPHHKEGPHGRS